ncbi:MAG: PAS-domain containing protein [Pseudomonadota bacterium]
MTPVPSQTELESRGEGALDAVLEQLSDGVIVVSPDRHVVAFNRRYAEMFRLRPGDVVRGDTLETLFRRVGERGGFLVSDDLLGAEITARLRAWGSEAARFERRTFPDGRVFDIYRSATDDGNIVGVHIDVTEQIAGEIALERQRVHMRCILENIPDGVCLVDRQGYFIAFNDQFLALYGVPREAAHWGMHFRELAAHFADLANLDPERREAETQRRLSFAIDPEQTRIERQLFTGATLEIVKSQLPEGGCVITMRDITEQLRQQRALEEERRHAEEASQHKSRFLARMSHEMRTPLNGILGISALLERTELDDKQRTYTDVIRNSGGVLLRLIDDVLDTARVESEHFSLTLAPFSLSEVVREAIGTIEPEVRKKGLILRKSPVDPSMPALVGDAVRIKQIILNLLTNAVKFTDEGEVGVSIAARLGVHDAQFVISVSDTGIGIPEAEQERIFAHFYQAEEHESRRFGGLGLGLAISDRLVRQMDGQIKLHSTPSTGSRFDVHLTLPFAQLQPPPAG